MDTHVVILAAGKGTRMKSALPKVLHRVASLPLIDYVLAGARTLRPRSTTVVVGHQAHALKVALHQAVALNARVARRSDLPLVVREPHLGTAHALLQTEPVLRTQRGLLVLLSGDVPLLTAETLKRLVDRHGSQGASMTVVTAP